jgi:Zn finger protein HypA/HybF involved in hydrogenase expression
MMSAVPEDELQLAVAGSQLRCQECRAAWSPAETTQWFAFLSEPLPPRIVLYCPQCASREFEITRR